MAEQIVAASSAIDMIGPYLASRVVCPYCTYENTFVHLEGPGSDVKNIGPVCSHIRAHQADDDGNSQYHFSDEPREPREE